MTSPRELAAGSSPLGSTARPRTRLLRDQADIRLQDPQALDEIDLYGEVVIAASACEGPLTLEQLDRVLGLR